MSKLSLVLAPLAALALGLAVPASSLLASTPCCSIVSIDKSTGVVTLRDNGTGKLETVNVNDQQLLARLSVGQRADHGLRVRYCSIRSFEPCSDQSLTHDCQPCPSGH
jgi:hypothetical protein